MRAFETTRKEILARLGGQDGRPPFESLYIYALMAFIGFTMADLGILQFRDTMLPTKAPPGRPEKVETFAPAPRTDYDVIISRNPFNSDHFIPEPIGKSKEGGEEGEPVPSSLPLTLLGTIVHVNPKKSVATISVTSANKVLPYQVGQEIESLAKVVKIERQKVIFRNLQNNRLEFIEIKKDLMVKQLGLSRPTAAIEVDGTDVTIKRSEVMKYTANLSEVLNQASAVPNFIPGSGGKINGYRLVNIAPGSIYEKLGLRRFDVIKSVNGEPVDSPAKAMELYNQLKNSNQIAIGIERNGMDETHNFTITQ